MQVSQAKFQSFVHAIEQGRLAPLFRAIVGGVILLAVALLYLFVQFSGFSTATAMDQAQISRALASGEGFSTKNIRPMALWKLNEAELPVPENNFPDFIQPPLFPALTALPLLMAKGGWDMKPTDLVYAGDRAIALFSILLFVAAVAVGFFVARRLFDAPLALIACLLVLVTDLLWQFSLSGLSHMLLLLLFMITSYVILRAMGAQEEKRRMAWILQAMAGGLFGLMTLTNWLACWIFIGYLFFAFFYFRPRFLPVVAILTFAAVLTPWLVRNAIVCGNPFGLAIYPMGQEMLMRSLSPDFGDLFYGFKMKFRVGVVDQIGNIFAYLGLNIAAGAFFLALFHPFRRPETAAFRWCVLTMWVGAVIGMAAYGPIPERISELQLHSIFIPLMVFFGLAFLLVLWNRLGFQLSIMRLVFSAAAVFLCAIPMLLTLFAGQGRGVNWPPYIPPYIAILGEWYKEDEALCSDMPWAVAWYAQQKCLLLPDTPETMVKISDYDILGMPIRGLYLTPVSGNSPFLSEIASGKYKAWAGLILRQPLRGVFPLKAVLPLPIDNQCVLYADYDRWSRTVKEP